MTKTVQLSTLEPGATFKFGGYEWIKLEQLEKGTLCLARDIVCNKAFDEDNCNDWRKSSLRKWLDNEHCGFMAEIARNKLDIRLCTCDLTSDEGKDD